MFKFVLINLVGLLFIASGAAGYDNPEGFKPYLDLSIPYPRSIPVWDLEPLTERETRDFPHQVQLIVDKKGKVQEIQVLSGHDNIQSFLTEKKKDIRFDFLAGRDFDFPLTVPVNLIYTRRVAGRRKATMAFPLGPDLVSDSMLLKEFYEANNITPPAITFLQPVFYRFKRESRDPRYMMITAWVSLDEKGEMADIKFPFPGQDHMTHQIQMALMRATFDGAVVGGRPVACDLLLTFRVFDNLVYPFSPFQPPDSNRAPAITRDYFVASYFNAGDISHCPLPRRYRDGKVPVLRDYRYDHWRYKAAVWITPEGNARLKPISGLGAREKQINSVLDITRWYPAMDAEGNLISFTGTIELYFHGAGDVVCIPEWLKK